MAMDVLQSWVWFLVKPIFVVSRVERDFKKVSLSTYEQNIIGTSRKRIEGSKLTFLTTCRRASDIKFLLARKNFNLPEKKLVAYNKFWGFNFEKKKIVKCSSLEKALNLQNMHSCVFYFKNQVFVRDVMLVWRNK